MFDIVYITNLPAFYKINLFNRISKNKKILVIYTEDRNNQRNTDFYSGDPEFEFISLGQFKKIEKIIRIIRILKKLDYKQLIVGGWDYFEFWTAVILSPSSKNSLVLESSILESASSGFKGFLKRVFINRISKVYASGKAQAELAKILKFKGEIRITKSVGIFNIVKQPIFIPVKQVSKFIYIGRLSSEKNIELLIKTFNKLPHLTLNIIGFGPLEEQLKRLSGKNIYFHGAIENKELPKYYQNNHVFILPSISEPWGLVVEEAFNNGLPVIVSNQVGCSSEIITEDKNGIIFQLKERDDLMKIILKITDINYYNSLRENVCKMDFETIANEQVNCYL